MKLKEQLQLLCWVLAPLGWGAFTWFMGWGQGASYISYPLNQVVRDVVALAVVIYCFDVKLQYAVQQYQLQFFGHSFKIPSWKFFVLLAVGADFLRFTPLIEHELAFSLIQGVVVGALLEELITHSFLIAYNISLPCFVFLNFISSLAFTYMHSFYVQGGVSLCELFSRGHFGFCFMLGIIVYKTRRIELAIMLHMLSNLFRYTVPVIVFQCTGPSMVWVICSMLVEVIMLLALAGCSYKFSLSNTRT